MQLAKKPESMAPMSSRTTTRSTHVLMNPIPTIRRPVERVIPVKKIRGPSRLPSTAAMGWQRMYVGKKTRRTIDLRYRLVYESSGGSNYSRIDFPRGPSHHAFPRCWPRASSPCR